METDPKLLAQIAKLEKFVRVLDGRVRALEDENKKLRAVVKRQSTDIQILDRRR